MAIDTAGKRAAVLNIPWPDGSMGVVVRGAATRVYAGTFAATTTTTTAVPTTTTTAIPTTTTTSAPTTTTTTTTTTTAAPFYFADCTITTQRKMVCTITTQREMGCTISITLEDS